MEYSKFRELNQKLDEARDKYLELRDAKSNGCCHGMTIPQVMAYDKKIMDAHAEVLKLMKEQEELIKGGE